MADETAPTTSPAGSPQPGIGFRRAEDFWFAYSNNVQFESSAVDLKLIFGELDLHEKSKGYVEQHTSITITWVQAKLLSYFLNLNIVAHEIENGKIKIPNAMIPSIPFLPKELEDNPNAKAAVEEWKKLHAEFVAALLV